jgi:hypothetical protein
MSDVINCPLSAAIELCEQLDKGTPETDAFFFRIDIDWDMEVEFARKLERERDEARINAERSKAYKRVLKVTNQNLKRERDEARENLDQEMKFHHRTHAELVQTQCKLLDMEMKCDQLQDEIKRLKIILDLIKRDVS